MYISKHKRPNGRLKQSAFLTVLIILTITITVGGTVAFLFTKTGSILNIFNPSKVTTEVVETFAEGGTTVNSVSIKNTGDIDAYIRAAVIVTWQDASGNVYAKTPVENVDYTITWSGVTGGTWFKNTDNGYYYHEASVAPEGTTSVLFAGVTILQGAPAGYNLHIEVLGSGIQSTPDDVVQKNWSVTVSSGALTQ